MPRFLWKKASEASPEQFYAASAFGSIFLVLPFLGAFVQPVDLDNQQVRLLEVRSHPTTSTPPRTRFDLLAA